MTVTSDKPRASGTMTESQFLAWIRSALRSKWLRWPVRAEVLRSAQMPYVGPNARRKFSYLCALCKGLFAQKDVEVDHFPKNAGSILSVQDIGQFASNLYCEADNLRVLCKNCHKTHTLSEKKGIDFQVAAIERRATEFLKQGTQIVVDYCLAKGYNGSLRNAKKRREALVAIFTKELS